MKRVTFPAVVDPLVSIVMVTYGAWPWPGRTLKALAAYTEACYEVIVIDNASVDDTAANLRRDFDGISLVENRENTGFGPASNQGASLASGRYLCLLNSDVLVEPGWLAPLLRYLEQNLTAGSVVPMICNLDGSLQEAGQILGGDAEPRAYGLGDDPENFEYRFRRRIDYGSAACMLLRVSEFRAIGGFDSAFRLGYYEDVDLCFRLASRGLSCWYEPASRVRHAQGASSPEYEARRRLADANRVIISRRWKAKLALRPPLAHRPGALFRDVAMRDLTASNRLLLVASRVPADDGSPIARLLAAVTSLWPEIRVTVVASDPVGANTRAIVWLARGVEVAIGEDWPTWFRRRWFHESIVVFDDKADRSQFERLVDETQPQARRADQLLSVVSDPRLLVEVMAELGIAPPAESVSETLRGSP